MPMSDKDRELYLKERVRIAREMGVPEEEVVLLDVDSESAAWIEESGLAGEEAKVDRAKTRAAGNREEGGE